MKLVVLGDIHGRPYWKDIVAAEDCSSVIYIFLGDYVSTHDDISGESQIKNMEEILDFAESRPCQCVLLRGNHDLQHLYNDYMFQSCAYDYKVAEYMHEIRDRFMDRTQWVYIFDDILFSHAGVSAVWMENCGISRVEQINDLDYTWFGFTPDFENNPGDRYGRSVTQPPTWIRIPTILNCMPEGWKQVVGHTTLTKLCNIPEFAAESGDTRYAGKTLWGCDTQLESYLVIEDGVFTVKPTPSFKSKEIE